MQILTRLRFLMRNLVWRGRAENRIAEELRGYERLLTEELTTHGLDPVEARRRALVEMGGVEFVKENVRADRGGAWIEGLMQDVRYGFRSLRRTPAFTLTAVVALALGIGASTAIFSVVNGVLLRPLPYASPDDLVTVLHNGSDPVSAANFLDWREQTTSFSHMAVAEYWSPNVSGSGNTERIVALRLSGQMFPLLGVSPILGRVFRDDEERSGSAEVVIGYNLWRQRFAGDSNVIGQSMLMDGVKHVVIGVMPRDFAFAPFWARDAQMWAPLDLRRKSAERGANSLRAFARLKTGATLQSAQRDISNITARLEMQFPRTNVGVEVTPLLQQATAGMDKPLTVLMIAVAFLLVAACANVAHMMLARSSSRQREMAVRMAIGASRGKLVRQLLAESLMLSSAGGLFGALLASAGTRTLVVMGGSTIPRAESVAFDARVLLLTILISVLTGVLFGIAPARTASRTELVSSLKDGGRSAAAASAHAGFRHALVASQFAIAMILLVGAGLMMRTLVAMNAVEPGFVAEGVMSAEVSVSGTQSATEGNRANFYNRLSESLRAIPGVQAVGSINHLPLAGDVWGLGVTIEGSVPANGNERRSAAYRVISPGYFSTMGITFERGQDFGAGDRVGSTPVAIVNHAFAERYWPGEDAVGKRFAVSGGEGEPVVWRTVTGIVRNVVRSNWTERPEPEMYLPLMQEPSYLAGKGAHLAYMTFVVRSTGDAEALAAAFRRTVSEIDPAVSVSSMNTMTAVIAGKSSSQRFYFMLLAAFAIAAITLAAVGIYGVMSHAVARRRHEMGVRIALGASRNDVMSLVVGKGMRVVLVGAALGIGGALALTRLMTSILYGVRASDPATFVSVAVLLLGVALVACVIPALRATRVPPVAALRGD